MNSILVVDDTTLYESDKDLDSLLKVFNKKLSKIYEWISYNQMSLNWSKTKIMFLTKKRINFSSSYSLLFDDLLYDGVSSKEVEVVT